MVWSTISYTKPPGMHLPSNKLPLPQHIIELSRNAAHAHIHIHMAAVPCKFRQDWNSVGNILEPFFHSRKNQHSVSWSKSMKYIFQLQLVLCIVLLLHRYMHPDVPCNDIIFILWYIYIVLCWNYVILYLYCVVLWYIHLYSVMFILRTENNNNNRDNLCQSIFFPWQVATDPLYFFILLASCIAFSFCAELCKSTNLDRTITAALLNPTYHHGHHIII